MGFNSAFKGLKQNNFNDMDMFKEWKMEDCQKKLRNGLHREEENEVDLNTAIILSDTDLQLRPSSELHTCTPPGKTYRTACLDEIV